jgi:hypothetical protein
MTDQGHFVASIYPNNGHLNVSEAIPVTLAHDGDAASEGVCPLMRSLDLRSLLETLVFREI